MITIDYVTKNLTAGLQRAPKLPPSFIDNPLTCASVSLSVTSHSCVPIIPFPFFLFLCFFVSFR